jgi:dolichol-phosphate mannosyltransferase
MPACLVLPTYNEAENLPELIARVHAAAPNISILVVDDDSPDGTADLAAAIAERDARVSVLCRKNARGYGTALTEGIRHALGAGAPAVLTMDCDFSHDPADVPRLLTALEGADVVVGSRYTEGGRVRAWSLARRLLSAGANLFVRALFRIPARDCTSGFRGYRRHVLEAMPWDRFHSEGYSFLVEVLYFATRDRRTRLLEVPIVFIDRTRGTSKMGLKEIVLGATNLIRARLGAGGG